MAPVVGMVNVMDMVNGHDGRAEAGPYDALCHVFPVLCSGSFHDIIFS